MNATRWSELKEAFYTVVDLDAAERARRLAALASSDPELHRQLEALLAADARGESLQPMFGSEAPVPPKPPARIGAYTVTGVLGAGGMGEVYRAHDSRLRREVAIKILPAAFTADPERLKRFEREAQVLASLNHPHIAHVYGLEDAGGEMPALVMEIVEGPTLDELIANSSTRIPLTQVLTIARQIADGLDAAHEKGIIHRDLKPRNVVLTERGDVKILDFGVAKIIADDQTNAAETVDATDAGSVLGTPAYMSPEQARGMPIDKRTDVWAFGCILYELLSRRRPFAGQTASDSIAAVLERDPDMTVLPADTPASLRSLIRHCLVKDRRHRLRDIADARLAIDDLLNQSGDARPEPVVAAHQPQVRTSIRQRVVWMLGGIGLTAVVAAIVLTQWRPSRPPSGDRRMVHASILLPRGIQLGGGDLEARSAESRFAVSPDGRRLVLVAADGSTRIGLWLRDIASGALHHLPGTEGASYPFWSPDSEHIAFIAGGKLRRIPASGGTSTIVCDGGFRTGTWGPHGVIVFAAARSSPLSRVAASGGEATPITKLDTDAGEVQHSLPSFLPDGRHFLYFSVGSKTGGAIDPRGVFVGSLDGTAPPRLLIPGATYARYASGHVLFVRAGTLMSQQMDLDRIELRGEPVSLVERVKVPNAGQTGIAGAFSVSDDGVLVYQTGIVTQSQPVWLDRAGKALASLAVPREYDDFSLSPDGASLAMSVVDPALSTSDLWLYSATTGRGQRFTFQAGEEFAPVWSPDGRRLLFSSMTTGAVDLYLKAVSGVSSEQPLQADTIGLGRFAADWSRDGRFIMYVGGGRIIMRSDLWIVPPDAPQDARALLDSAFVETHGRFSPDSRWFSYTSNESGSFEVYVDRFPERGQKQLVSTAGGGWARWSRDGREIFYLSPDNRVMAVPVKLTKNGLDIGAPRALFAPRLRPPGRLDAYPYDVSADGQRFLVNALSEETTSTAITLVLNWAGALRKR